MIHATSARGGPGKRLRFRPSFRRPDAARPIVNALTVDVEEYFQVSAFAHCVPPDSWAQRASRVEHNVERVLALLELHGVQATFFTLGWVAERQPGLVRRIARAGHEIASHGYLHQRATVQSRQAFLNDIAEAKRRLEDAAGTEVAGYRAPSFSIGAGNLWALECVAEAGYRYSSSIYPIRHDHYGLPSAPRFAFQPVEGLWELPVATVRLLGRNLPAGGGGYFRLLPYVVSHWCLNRVNRHDGLPCVFYFHPWELDPEQPRVPGAGMKSRFRHYCNLERTEARLHALLEDFRWDRVDRVLFGESRA